MKVKLIVSGVALAMLSLSTASLAATGKAHEKHDAHAAPHWTYSGPTGAAKWGDMQADFATCKLGKEQSPIDIKGAAKADLAPIEFGYKQSAAEVVNNGHTIQVNLKDGGMIKLGSGSYKLLQFHFHTPSEEKVNGKAYPMVAHLVHKSDAGELAVVAVLFKNGKKNRALTEVFSTMPTKADAAADLPGGLNAADFLPEKQGYYAFVGSLTTPPCSEGVRWQVLKDPVELSQGQLNGFKRLYPMNARPVQPLNGRKLQESN